MGRDVRSLGNARGYEPAMASMHAFADSRLASASANELIASDGRQARPRGLARDPGARRRARRGCASRRWEPRASFSGFSSFPRPFSRLEEKCADRITVPRTCPGPWRHTRSSRRASPCSNARIRKRWYLARLSPRRKRRRWRGAFAFSSGGTKCRLRVRLVHRSPRPRTPDRERPAAASHRLPSLITRHARATGPRLSSCLARRRTTRVWRTRANPWTRRRLGRARCASSTRKRRDGPVWRSSA